MTSRWKHVSGLAGMVMVGAAVAAAQPSGPDGNLPIPAERMEQRLEQEEFTIASAEPAGGGIMGAKKLELVFPTEPAEIAAKWKTAPSGADGWNNSPRREIGAYVVQRLFLDPEDQVVPPVAARCVPLDVYRVVEADPSPTLEGTSCVYGALSAWLDNVMVPEKAFDRERFTRDARYDFSFANANLLAYLIAHRDVRPGNFLISTDPANPQLFSVDNGIAFGGVLYNFFVHHFDEIRVRGLPKQSIDRLRRVTRHDLDALGVLGQLEVDGAGVLRNVEPTANVAPDEGTRLSPGHVQFGLTTDEIDGIEERLRDLLERIDAGELDVF